MEAGTVVVLHLIEPAEKYWGQLRDLSPSGITIRAINLESFDDWLRVVAYGEESTGLGLATIFFPLRRVERMFVDEGIGEIESLKQMFERRVGRSVFDVLSAGEAGGGLTH